MARSRTAKSDNPIPAPKTLWISKSAKEIGGAPAIVEVAAVTKEERAGRADDHRIWYVNRTAGTKRSCLYQDCFRLPSRFEPYVAPVEQAPEPAPHVDLAAMSDRQIIAEVVRIQGQNLATSGEILKSLSRLCAAIEQLAPAQKALLFGSKTT